MNTIINIIIDKISNDADYSALTKLSQILKFLSLKLVIESELLSIKIFLVKVTLEIVREKYLLWILF